MRGEEAGRNGVQRQPASAFDILGVFPGLWESLYMMSPQLDIKVLYQPFSQGKSPPHHTNSQVIKVKLRPSGPLKVLGHSFMDTPGVSEMPFYSDFIHPNSLSHSGNTLLQRFCNMPSLGSFLQLRKKGTWWNYLFTISRPRSRIFLGSPPPIYLHSWDAVCKGQCGLAQRCSVCGQLGVKRGRDKNPRLLCLAWFPLWGSLGMQGKEPNS